MHEFMKIRLAVRLTLDIIWLTELTRDFTQMGMPMKILSNNGNALSFSAADAAFHCASKSQQLPVACQ
jgi:hypothetical protein